MSGVVPIIKSRYETGFKKVSQQQKKEDIRWQVSEKLQRSQEFHLLLYRE